MLREHERSSRRYAFAPDQIAKLQSKPKAIGGERVVPVVFTVALAATALWFLAMSSLPFN